MFVGDGWGNIGNVIYILAFPVLLLFFLLGFQFLLSILHPPFFSVGCTLGALNIYFILQIYKYLGMPKNF